MAASNSVLPSFRYWAACSAFSKCLYATDAQQSLQMAVSLGV
jgi:hypothetical protein